MEKYEVQNVIPFNDIYYINCMYLCLFTAIRHYTGTVFNYIANDYFIYELEKTPAGLSLMNTSYRVSLFDKIALTNGLIMECKKDHYKDIVNTIKNILLEGGIVVLPVDGFYYKNPYHDLFYLKEHHYQEILVYGFDSEREIFNIIDVNGFAWNTGNFCLKNEMTFQVIIDGHEGVVNNMPGRLTLTSFVMSKNNPGNKANEDPYCYKDIMIENMMAHKKEIMDGLQNIVKLADNIDQFNINESIVYNNKIATLSNQFKIKNILGKDYLSKSIAEICEPLFKDIFTNWSMVEGLIYKNLRKKVKDNQIFISYLNQIFKLENLLYDNLFSFFDRINQQQG